MEKRSALPYAFRQTLPVLFGYLCLGAGFGLLLANAGYNVLWSFCISLTCYSGSMQYMLVVFLTANPPVTVLYTALMTLIVNSRHIFYGLSFIERFKSMGLRGLYMIFSLTDETYSLLCAQTKIPQTLDEDTVFFHIAWLDQSYWIVGCMLGTLIGNMIPFDFTGVEFTMTALFTVIFLDQWETLKTHVPALVGLAVSGICLAIIGPERYMFPALAVTALVLLALKKQLDGKKEEQR